MWTDPLRGVADATIVIGATCALFGYIVGLLTAVTIWWRPIRHARYDSQEATIYKRALQDVEQREQRLRAQNTDLACKLIAAQQGHQGEHHATVPRLSRKARA